MVRMPDVFRAPLSITNPWRKLSSNRNGARKPKQTCHDLLATTTQHVRGSLTNQTETTRRYLKGLHSVGLSTLCSGGGSREQDPGILMGSEFHLWLTYYAFLLLGSPQPYQAVLAARCGCFRVQRSEGGMGSEGQGGPGSRASYVCRSKTDS